MASLEEQSKKFSRLISSSVWHAKNSNGLNAEEGVTAALKLLEQVERFSGSIYLIGNGGSAAVASHIANDLCNTVGLRAMTLHDAALLTCYSNDYGYENAYALLIERMASENDLLIAISSSGDSKNIRLAAEKMKALKGSVITLSGFSSDNSLRNCGDLNIWLDSTSYGDVEVGHLYILHYLSDRYAQEQTRNGG